MLECSLNPFLGEGALFNWHVLIELVLKLTKEPNHISLSTLFLNFPSHAVMPSIKK